MYERKPLLHGNPSTHGQEDEVEKTIMSVLNRILCGELLSRKWIT